jgi:pimeloyl-ACP methyl ester carboxylesterase
MRRFLVTLALLLGALIALPPLWYAAFPPDLPKLAMPASFATLESGARVHYIERGEGPVVVLVHGLPGQAEEWRATTDLLAAHGRRVLAIDRIGYGHSDAREGGDYTLAANTRELRGFLDALRVHDATIVGWSYGGGTALTLAREDATRDADSRVGRIVLIGSIGPSDVAPGPPPAAAAIFSVVVRWARLVPPVGRAMQRALSANAFSEQPQPAWWLPGLAANLAQAKTQRAFTREGDALRGTAMPDSAGLALPILVIHGDDDRLVPVSVGRTLARNNPRAEFLEVAGGSHMLPITHAQLLADRIALFSAAPPAAEPVVLPGAEGNAPIDTPEHWMDALAAN